MSLKSPSTSTSALRLIVICGVLTAFPSMSIDLGLPGFAAMAKSLGVSVEQVSQTLSLFFVGFSISPLIYGPLSDRVGRRPVLLFACFIYAIASVLATVTSSFGALLFWRLLQGTGAGAASVLAITVIRDHHQGASARRLLSYAAVVRIVGPTTAPSIGNLLLLLGGWRWIYGFMALGGILMSVMVAFGLPESSRVKLAANARLKAPIAQAAERVPRRSVIKDYRAFLSDRLGLSYALIGAFTFGSHFSYVTGSLYVYVNVLHVSNAIYGLVFGITALCLMLGSFLSGVLSKHDVPGNVILTAALGISVLSSLTTLTLAVIHHLHLPVLTTLLSVNALCIGLLTPSAQQGALENAGAFAGTASALMNALMTGMGAFASYIEGTLLGWFNESPAVVMSGQMTLLCGCAALTFFICVRLQRAKRATSTINNHGRMH